jgi:DNA-binding winged helix-turn-helix (wHTH) protein/Tol biopolymer transport system component
MRAVFGPFSFDLCDLELSKNGLRLRLEEKPARLLACLIERKGEIVSRDELRGRLWPVDVNLDFDHGLNKAVNKLRATLGDDAAKPKYLETLSKRGYRFIHAVELMPDDETALERVSDPPPANVPTASGGETGTREPLDAELQAAGPDVARSRPPFRTWLSLAAGIVGIFALLPATGMLSHLRRVRHVRPKPIGIPAELKLITVGDGTLALSPDGTQVVFAAAGIDRQPRLWLLDLNSSHAKELPGTEGGTMPFWSPDGNRLGFFTGFELKTIDLTSYAIKVLAPGNSARGGSWSSRGVILFASETRGPIQRIPADGGAVVPVTIVDMKIGATTDRWPAFFPDGNHFVYLEANHDTPEAPGRVMLASLDGSTQKFLVESDSNAVPGSDRLTFVSHGKLLSVSMNPHTLEPDASANMLAEGVDCDRGSWYCAFSLNRAGVLYRPRNGTADRETISWFDAAGNKIADLGQPGIYRSISLSPDGKTAAVTCGDPDQKVCLVRDDGTVTRLDSVGLVSGSIWAPDSSAIAYSEHLSSSDFRSRIKPVLQPRPARTVMTSMTSRIDGGPIAWHPNGRFLLFSRTRPGGTFDLGILDLRTGETMPYLPEDKSEVDMAEFSPDGEWVAFDKQTGGLKQIYLASFPVPSVIFPLTTEGGCAAKWRGDGHAIYYLGPGDMLYAVSVAHSPAGFRIGKPNALFHPPIFFAPWNCISFDVARDGRRFVVNTVASPKAQELVSISY